MTQAAALRVAINCGAEGSAPRAWSQVADYVREAEHLGVDDCWTSEAWSSDAMTPIAYLAGRTERIRLGTGIAQVFNRTPASLAMTALTLASMTSNRFVLGLGVSGPQIVEGLHGATFTRPLQRLTETVEILRLAFRGERMVFKGEVFELPRPGGEGKAIRLALPPNAEIPIYLATLAPRALEMTGRLADGWLGTAFVPERADAFLAPIGAGASAAGRALRDLDLQEGGEVAFGDDVEEMLSARKAGLAFTLGGMGSASTNYYNDAYSRQGYAEVAEEVRQLWVRGDRVEAARQIPDDLVIRTTLLGTPDMVKQRIRAVRASGITTLRLYPAGDTAEQRLDTLGRALDLVRDVNAEHIDLVASK